VPGGVGPPSMRSVFAVAMGWLRRDREQTGKEGRRSVQSVQSEEQEVGPPWRARVQEILHHGALVLAVVPHSPERAGEGVPGGPLAADGPEGDGHLDRRATWRRIRLIGGNNV
jgi:hypothetical protein